MHTAHLCLGCSGLGYNESPVEHSKAFQSIPLARCNRPLIGFYGGQGPAQFRFLHPPLSENTSESAAFGRRQSGEGTDPECISEDAASQGLGHSAAAAVGGLPDQWRALHVLHDQHHIWATVVICSRQMRSPGYKSIYFKRRYVFDVQGCLVCPL